MVVIGRVVSALMFMSSVLLAGCQTMPAPSDTHAGLTVAQTDTLKSQGFVQTESGWQFGFADKLLFPTNKSQVDDVQRQVIERITRALLAVQITAVRVEGHTDNSGTETYNNVLSLERARMVAKAMIGAGMPSAGVKIEGLGRGHPIASNDTSAGRQENRRVVIIISS